MENIGHSDALQVLMSERSWTGRESKHFESLWSVQGDPRTSVVRIHLVRTLEDYSCTGIAYVMTPHGWSAMQALPWRELGLRSVSVAGAVIDTDLEIFRVDADRLLALATLVVAPETFSSLGLDETLVAVEEAASS